MMLARKREVSQLQERSVLPDCEDFSKRYIDSSTKTWVKWEESWDPDLSTRDVQGDTMVKKLISLYQKESEKWVI
jgi:hypothetical protein